MPQQRRRREKMTFTFDPDVMDLVKDAAWAERLSPSRYLERAALAWMEAHPPAVSPPPATDESAP
ncbi:MAG: hypothetical protein IT195_12525 [Microthrixaceae bacterium]|nr:hypothetical protein [Microthrixaceae bacterium]